MGGEPLYTAISQPLWHLYDKKPVLDEERSGNGGREQKQKAVGLWDF